MAAPEAFDGIVLRVADQPNVQNHLLTALLALNQHADVRFSLDWGRPRVGHNALRTAHFISFLRKKDYAGAPSGWLGLARVVAVS
jgi:hypothetical protein